MNSMISISSQAHKLGIFYYLFNNKYFWELQKKLSRRKFVYCQACFEEKKKTFDVF